MKPLATMNVIPFIDIMLVLLAIVLTTATFVAQGRIPVTLPQSSTAAPLEPVTRVEITVAADGGLFLDDEAVSLQVLGERLDRIEAQAAVMLRVDQAAAFRHFVAVIDLMQARELQNVSIAARRDAVP